MQVFIEALFDKFFEKYQTMALRVISAGIDDRKFRKIAEVSPKNQIWKDSSSLVLMNS